MQIIYQYLISTLLPANIETELQGGSIPRKPSSPFAALHHGRFITGPVDLKSSSSSLKVPKVFFFSSGNTTAYYMVVYRALSASICLFIDGKIQKGIAVTSFITDDLLQ